MRRLIITAVDNNLHYMEGLKVFLASLAKNAPEELVYVYLMNCSREYEDSLHEINSNLMTMAKSVKEVSPYVRNYIRHRLVHDQLKIHDKILWLDNDSIVRGCLDDIWLDVEENTIKFWLRKKNKDHLKFQGGVYVIGKGEKSENYCKLISKGLSTMSDWYAPQTLMYTCIKHVGLKQIQLETKYNDSKFKDDSIIWHCKSSHFNDKKYQKEYKHYEQKRS